MQNPDVLAITTDYTCNEWLDECDKQVFENMKINDPRRYRVAGLGEWGITEGLVYENWEEKAFDIDEIRAFPNAKAIFGLDFGYTNDPTALFCGIADRAARTIWVFDEMYKKGMSNEAIAQEVIKMGYGKERIRADAAEPKSIDRLYDLGLRRIHCADKGRDSVNNGIDLIRSYKLIIHPKCVNFLTEISNYTWKTDRGTGKLLNTPDDKFDHLMDAMRYAAEELAKPDSFSFE